MHTVARPLYQRQEFARAIRAARLPALAFELFDELAARAGVRGFAWTRQDELARVLGVSTRTVRRVERGLEEAGLLAVRRASLWAKRIRGGTVRVLVLAVAVGGRLEIPILGLEGAAEAVRNLWRTRLEARQTNRTPVSGHYARARSEPAQIHLPISPSGLARTGEWARAMLARFGLTVPRGTLPSALGGLS